jgi:hypothetical protein
MLWNQRALAAARGCPGSIPVAEPISVPVTGPPMFVDTLSTRSRSLPRRILPTDLDLMKTEALQQGNVIQQNRVEVNSSENMA